MFLPRYVYFVAAVARTLFTLPRCPADSLMSTRDATPRGAHAVMPIRLFTQRSFAFFCCLFDALLDADARHFTRRLTMRTDARRRYAHHVCAARHVDARRFDC